MAFLTWLVKNIRGFLHTGIIILSKRSENSLLLVGAIELRNLSEPQILQSGGNQSNSSLAQSRYVDVTHV